MTLRRSGLLVFAVLLASSGASAQPAPASAPPTSQPSTPAAAPPLAEALPAQAREAYESARLLMRNDDFAGALTKFQQAYDLSKEPRLLYDMAICNKNLHAYARMQTLLETYERDAAPALAPDERKAVDAALDAIKGLVGTLRLTVTPDEATVLIDGVPAATSPIRDPVFVDLGKHTLTVKRAGFDPAERVLDIAGRNVVELSVALVPTAHLADLFVETPEAATVSIDGKVVASGKYHEKISSGPHTVRVTEPGMAPYESTLELHDGDSRTLDVSLRDSSKHVLWPWLTGGVAVVAGLAVGGYFLFKPADTTTPPPAGKLGGVQLSGFRR